MSIRVFLGCFLAAVALVCITSTVPHVSTLRHPIVPSRSRVGMAPSVVGVRKAVKMTGVPSCQRTKAGPWLCNNGLVVIKAPQNSRSLSVQASEKPVDVEGLISDLKDKVDNIENKPRAALVAGGVVLALSVTNAVVTTIDALPLLPGLMKLIGTTYSTWFLYRNVLFEENRKELTEDIESVWNKIAGK
mmetsp:Transcript_24195/g.36273  ORF Transcript_24195/g.36273 Transcript_24195/m.36273 type:complete len:189 (-) Transcript_24195:176-742(-)|eukprot:CAMPEP_0167745118 /NCGR_PEP_ID=MMETSP0110_2-20121227/2973_1 /TAXON_ID=629695 /ORGANISM="Gymnochlora sp., Strain CCMP2014" /LENGTH=188 /DNA_ID=CAMNT_0007629723 /DNA_START=19 /DNA_END=585 /DNA_ORIENTATION=-